MFFSRSSASSSNNEPTSSFRRLSLSPTTTPTSPPSAASLSLSHNDTPISSPRFDPISSFVTSFSTVPALLIALSDEPTSSFRRLSFSHDDIPLCWSCDAAVHDTNFLVARYVRRLACASGRAVDSGPDTPHPPPADPYALPILPPHRPPCPSALSSVADADDDVLGVGVDVGVVKLSCPCRLNF